MKIQEIQKLISDEHSPAYHPLLASELYQLTKKHLGAVEVYTPDDPSNPARDVCNAIVKKLDLLWPPHIVVVEDKMWQAYLSLPRHKASGYVEGFYSHNNCVYLPRSLFEAFGRREPFGSYIAIHEHGHAVHEEPHEIKNYRRDELYTRRNFLSKIITSMPTSLATMSFCAFMANALNEKKR